MSTNKSSPYYGPLKGEIELTNGSKILFNAADWTFSHMPIDGCTLKAKETNKPIIMAWDPAKGDCFTAWKVSKEQETPEPQIQIDGKSVTEQMKHVVETKKLKSMIKKQHELLEEMYKVLLEYAETFPREIELRDRAYPLINRVYENLKEWADNALASENKKQEESTDLFDVISKTMHNFPNACNATAQSKEDKIMATYYTDTHTWELAVWRPQGESIPIGKTTQKTNLQAMAEKHNIDLSKGWRVINHQYKY